MATDWIRMRTDLYRDPKVSVIADLLMEPRGPLGRYVNQMCQCDMAVTRNVMRNVTVGALVSVWGVMRQRGKRNGDALQCSGVTALVLDDIADLPGFGDAMVACGWVVETDDGIEFPNFFEEYNSDPHEAAKSKNAQRQAAYRARKKAEEEEAERNVTRDVTVTPREEKRREEKNSSPDGEEIDAPGGADLLGDQVKPAKKPRKPKAETVKTLTVADLEADGVAPDAAAEFLAHRARKRAPLTPLAWSGFKDEVARAGWSAQQAVKTALQRGWIGFDAGWVAPRTSAGPGGLGMNKQEALEARNRAIGEEWARQMREIV